MIVATPHKHTPEISIVVPMYNVEKYIAECIESILGQTFENFELIIIDDKSTDRSLEIVRNYRDPRIKIYQQIKNSGEGASRNLGIEVSTGKYISFVDSDDIILPNTLETLYESAEELQADVIYMNQYFQMDNAEYVKRISCLNPAPRFFSMNLNERLQKEYLECGVLVMAWMQFLRRESILQAEIKFPRTFYCVDNLFKLAELCCVPKIAVIDFCGYIYRQHPEQMVKASAEKFLRGSILSLPNAIKYVRELFSSSRLISELPQETKISFELDTIFKYFTIFTLRAYREEKDLHCLDEILRDVVSNPELQNPDVIKNLIHVLAMNMLQQEEIQN